MCVCVCVCVCVYRLVLASMASFARFGIARHATHTNIARLPLACALSAIKSSPAVNLLTGEKMRAVWTSKPISARRRAHAKHHQA